MRLSPYKRPDDVRADFELLVTTVPLALLWFAMWQFSQLSYWLPLLLAPLRRRC